MSHFNDETPPTGLQRHQLDARNCIFSGRLPDELIPSTDEFQAFWSEHPQESRKIFLYGRWVPMPRFQQAYEVPYQFSGQLSPAVPAPPMIRRYLDWVRKHIDDRANGLLVNWYEPQHYIGPHKDAKKDLIPNSPIVTLSFGEARRFCMSKGSAEFHLTAEPGMLIVIPFSTNESWKHSVPEDKYQGRRISITARAFQSAGL